MPSPALYPPGLAFDGHHYQVVLVHIPNFEYSAATLELEIFSSKTNNWRRHTPDNLSLPFHPPADVFSDLATAPIFSNGAIHWEICGRLLVYNVQAVYFALINQPTEWCWQSATTYKRCFWESDGRVHYSYTDSQGVHTWILLNEFDLAYYSKINIIDCKEEFPWKLADSIHYQTLKENNPDIFKQGKMWETHYPSPFAYNEASQTMYMQLPGIVVSYNTKTRVLHLV
ncbi:hypothetical protein Dsin_002023 [Dipteronia sinensis]|uniref:F-box protein n=1 Tax=Dipteronia sinensis TaxID=43782 RepID=A0AAE0B6E5_9ROSI|nr:hypothetical protein Dsin_002023 [Dipteronia sinensis]